MTVNFVNLKIGKICRAPYAMTSVISDNSKRKAMNRNWCNPKANPALNTKAGNK